MNRREFLQTGAGALSAMLVLNPRTVFGSEANSAVRVGLLGCGNRGARAVRRKRVGDVPVRWTDHYYWRERLEVAGFEVGCSGLRQLCRQWCISRQPRVRG